MGNSSYSVDRKFLKSSSMNYSSKSLDDVFVQNKLKKVHPQMNSVGITFRESRDSVEHPNSVPIIIGLDVTGSMGHIPKYLIDQGLPNLVGGIIQNGIPDPQILFLAIGDHENDRSPLQIGQFESGDIELDVWLERTWIESGGGGNGGESYSLAHFFAANYCHTDSWEKRKTKGYLITIGDEPNLKNYPSNVIKEISGDGDVSTFTDTEIIDKAKEKWNVYHIIPGREAVRGTLGYWKEALGENAIWVDNYQDISTVIKDIVCKDLAVKKEENNNTNQSSDNTSSTSEDTHKISL